MRILLVEDDLSYADTLIAVANLKFPAISWVLVDNSSAAEDLISRNFYDLVILDLCMPSIPLGIEKDSANGQRLFYMILEIMPGTPIYILTGSRPDSFALDLSRHGEKVKLWGSANEFPTVLYFRKNKTTELFQEIAGIHHEIMAVNSVSINTRGKAILFTEEQARALKTFVRGTGGVDGVYYALNGLSGSLVGRVAIRDGRLKTISEFVGKLGPAAKIRRETESYYRHVRLMPINTYTPMQSGIDKGLKSFGAIFYTLAEGFDETLFQVIRRKPEDALNIIRQVRDYLYRWSSVREVSRVTVCEVRRASLSDEDLHVLAEKYDIDFVFEFENLYVNAARSCIHGDLHGGNILIKDNATPVLIDFGDVGEGYTGLDPITLEMSLIFHPDCVASGISHDIQKFMEHWPDVENYCQGNPFSEIVKLCRDWAYDESGDDSSVLAAGYAFAIRQLKYNTVEAESIIKLLIKIGEALSKRML